MSFPGRVWSLGEIVPESVLFYIASQLKLDPTIITEYSQRDTTRREHLAEIQNNFGFHTFNISTYKQFSKWLLPFAISSDKGMALVGALIDEMRLRQIIIPAISTVERLAWEVRHRAQKLVCLELTKSLTTLQKTALDKLLIVEPDKKLTDLIWLRQPPGQANPRNFLKVVERLEFIRHLNLDSGCLKRVHQNRLLQFTRLALALRELGRIERTLFTLSWLQSPELRRRATAGLNKGEAKHTLKRAVFFNRLGEIRDRSYEDQFYRASGLNLVIAAIVLWNTVYLEKAVDYLKQEGMDIPEEYLQHLSPLGWEHINLTGDYVWNLKQVTSFDKLRPLRVKENKYR